MKKVDFILWGMILIFVLALLLFIKMVFFNG